MENQKVLANDEFLEALKTCVEKCKANPELKAKLEEAPGETFKELTGKEFPKEGLKLTKEEIEALNEFTGKQLFQESNELTEQDLAKVNGGVLFAIIATGIVGGSSIAVLVDHIINH